jgi:hypothetical protein
MRRRGRCTIWCLTLAACVCVASCGRRSAPVAAAALDDDSAEQDVPPTKHHPVAELRVKIGTDLIPQDAGRLSVACPQGWEQGSDRTSAAQGYLLALHRKSGTLDELPRILIAAKDSPFPELKQVNEATLVNFVKAVTRTLGDKSLETPVTPVMAGETACAAYVELVKRESERGPRLVVMTLAGGRLYTINLDVQEPQFAKYRDAAYAIAASLKAVGPAEPPPIEKLPTEPPPAPAAEKKPEGVPAEPPPQ